MNIEITNLTKVWPTPNSDQNAQQYQDFLQGGSSVDFDTPASPEAGSIFNDFKVEAVDPVNILLDGANTFDEDVLLKLRMDPADIAFIHLFCFDTDECEKPIPVRFDVDINGNGVIGNMSDFQLNNIKSSALASLTISNITVADGRKALLTIIAGSSKIN